MVEVLRKSRKEIPSKEAGLGSWRSYDNPNKNYYQEVIRNAEEVTRDFNTPHSDHWDRLSDRPDFSEEQIEQAREAREFFRTKLKGGIVVNLGGWKSPFVKILGKEGPKEVINVDKHMHYKWDIDGYWERREKDEPDIPIDSNRVDLEENLSDGRRVKYVRADMLDFISQLPDNSVNIEIDGIDFNVIAHREYHQALAREIIRVLKKGGIVFGNVTSVLEKFQEETPDELQRVEFKILEGRYDSKTTPFLVFEKK